MQKIWIRKKTCICFMNCEITIEISNIVKLIYTTENMIISESIWTEMISQMKGIFRWGRGQRLKIGGQQQMS
jgi:hypothetical protein